jgi:hypothetical protein
MHKNVPYLVLVTSLLIIGLLPSAPALADAPGREGSTFLAPSLNPTTSLIRIAVDEEEWEHSTSVATCGGDQYLVVFYHDNSIYGQRITATGALLGTAFDISSGLPATLQAANPDVACDWERGRFVVVWEDYDGPVGLHNILAQGVYGSHQITGSQLIGSKIFLAATNFNETMPSIACNPDDHTCLVVYDFSGSGAGDIRGILMGVGETELSILVNNLTIGDYPVAETKADVAWGRAGSNYLVTWQYLYDGTPDHQVIMYAALCDTNCGANLILNDPAYLIGYYGYEKDQTDPSVAFNPWDDNFLVSFTYATPSGDTDVWAKFINGDGTADSGLRLVIADSSNPEYSSSIAWAGGAEALAGNSGVNQFSIAYILHIGDIQYNVMTQAVMGSHLVPGLSNDPLLLETQWDPHYLDGLRNPAACGSSQIGRYLITWDLNFVNPGGSVHNFDVFGRLVAPRGTYLPLVVKP